MQINIESNLPFSDEAKARLRKRITKMVRNIQQNIEGERSRFTPHDLLTQRDPRVCFKVIDDGFIDGHLLIKIYSHRIVSWTGQLPQKFQSGLLNILNMETVSKNHDVYLVKSEKPA